MKRLQRPAQSGRSCVQGQGVFPSTPVFFRFILAQTAQLYVQKWLGGVKYKKCGDNLTVTFLITTQYDSENGDL